MNIIIYVFAFISIILNNFSDNNLKSDKVFLDEEFVYLCNKPGQKCYYTIPCKVLRDNCNEANGKIFKVPLSRAIQMKREKCECQEGMN